MRREIIKSIVPLVVLTVVTVLITKMIGGWVASIGPMVVVLGAGMFWGNVLRARQGQSEEEGGTDDAEGRAR